MSQNDPLLEEIDAGEAAPIYVITGEEFLVRKVSDELVAKLLPKAMAGLNLSILEGVSPADVARDLATAPMFRGRKVVVVREPEFLAPKKGRGDALTKIREAWLAGRKKVAANRALALFAKASLGVDELLAPNAGVLAEELDLELAEADMAFLKELGGFCKLEGITAPKGDSSALEELLARGVPKDHHLIVEALSLDSKIPLTKLLIKAGKLVERKVERELRKLDIREVVTESLKPHKKRLDSQAEALLKDLCGGNMRLLQSELEKLAIYAGDRQIITAADVELLVRRFREEEFRELSDALGKRDSRSAIRYVETTLEQEDVPLKIHGAIASIVRNLLEDKERWGRMGMTAKTGKSDFDGRGYAALEKDAASKKGGRAPHPFVAWLRFQACMKFDQLELVRAHLAVAQADVLLKTGGTGRLVLEQLVLRICEKSGAYDTSLPRPTNR